jgi:hypothetical protein
MKEGDAVIIKGLFYEIVEMGSKDRSTEGKAYAVCGSTGESQIITTNKYKASPNIIYEKIKSRK